MRVNAEVITLFAERGGALRKCRQRKIGTAANLLDLGVRSIVPAEDWLRPGRLRELVTERCCKLISGSVSRPMFPSVASNSQCVGLHLDAPERGHRLPI